jgi:type II secretory ATPase GspE/PulE/Tfp pilus assembly ATPase PilB-like protein
MLRQDPDIILVGESRDPETAKTAIEAALTGHLVLTSLHANDSAAAITRIVDMGIEPFLVSASMSCSVAQRLVRQNCPHCMKPYAPDPATLSRVGLPMDHQYMRGSGCDKCAQTGYRGRLGVYEVMVMSPDIKTMITEKKSAAEVYRHAQQQGMETMLDDAKIKILQGLTTAEEVLRVVATEVS